MAMGVHTAPPARPPRRSSAKRSSPPPPHEMSGWRASLIILIAFCIAGVIPVGVIAKATGHFSLALPSNVLPHVGAPTATDAPDLNLPRDAWVTQSVNVLPQPGSGSALATLAPAFPVRLLQHQRAGSTVWSRIEWSGPVQGTGGAGWVPDAMLVSSGHTGSIMGDLGALAPKMRQVVAPYARQFSAMVYVPSQDRLYTQGAPDDAFALGSGMRSMLLSALYGGAEAQNKSISLPDALTIAHGDPTGTPKLYQTLGGATGLSLYLSSHSVHAFQTAPAWNACQTTPRGMIDFYTQFSGTLLQAKNRSAVISLLSLADAPTTTSMVASWARAAGNLLVVGTAQTGGSWTVSIAGVLNPPHGPSLMLVAVATGQSSSDTALAIMKAYYSALTTLFAG
jgi:hypothetical protein